MKVSNEPVKYLGSFLGIGSQVEQKNFENIWSKMQVKIHQWQNRVISLQAWVLVIKTLLFSCCIHVLNSVFINNKHLEQIQHLLNEFLWKGKNKINQAQICQRFEAGGLQMLCVKDLVDTLCIKWMVYLWKDQGTSWSVFVWPDALRSIPLSIWPGLTWVEDDWIKHLDPFYQGIF